MKKQIWLRPYQSLLVADCLKFVTVMLDYGHILSSNTEAIFARKCVIDALAEIVPLFEVKK